MQQTSDIRKNDGERHHFLARLAGNLNRLLRQVQGVLQKKGHQSHSKIISNFVD
jgi:hypothetical protein